MHSVSCNYLILQLTEGHRAQTESDRGESKNKSASDVTEHCWVGGDGWGKGAQSITAEEDEEEEEELLMHQQFLDKPSLLLRSPFYFLFFVSYMSHQFSL